VTEDLRYPIGPYQRKPQITAAERTAAIDAIARTPAALHAAVCDLTNEQMNTSYRPDGWTVRDLVHHLPDSHMNAYIRCKLALTEDEPVVKPFDEALWARLPDIQITPAAVSLALFSALHERWVALLRGISPQEFARRLNHPERGILSLDDMVDMYAWHGAHHVAHVTSLRRRMGWN
jgi:hypothetical protein